MIAFDPMNEGEKRETLGVEETERNRTIEC
jgi:hypothetical protein